MSRQEVPPNVQSSLFEGQPLPFHSLGWSKFEELVYLLLRCEYPDDVVIHLGQSGDKGIDITRSRAGGTYYEISQCKNIKEKLGPDKVTSELAKLFTNIYLREIPARPQKVVFYAPADLAVKAKNLLTHQHLWSEKARDSLTKHQKTEPLPQLLAFALDWWPEEGFHICEAVALSNRVSRFPDLIEQFFNPKTYYKSSGEQFNALNSRLENIEKLFEGQLTSVVQPPQSSSEALAKLKGDLPPGWEIEETSSTAHPIRMRRLIPGPGARPLTIGSLLFPRTELGVVGFNKFREHVERGVPLKLDKGEFTVELTEGLSLFEDIKGFEAMTAEKDLPTPRPAILESVSGGKVLCRVEPLNAKLVRQGTLETELLLSGGVFATSISLIVPKLLAEGSIAMHIAWDLTRVSARLALTTWRLTRDVLGGAQLRVTFSDSNQRFSLRAVQIPATLKVLDDKVGKFLQDLVAVNDAFDRDLRCPIQISTEIARDCAELASIIRTGEVRLGPGSFIAKMDAGTALALAKACSRQRTINTLFTFEEGGFELLSCKFDLGPVKVESPRTRLIGGVNRLQKAASLSGVDWISVKLSFEEVSMVYEQWSPVDTE